MLPIRFAWGVARDRSFVNMGQIESSSNFEGEMMTFDRRVHDGLSGFGLSSVRGLLYSALILGLALVCSMPMAAQRITGTLRGQVLDPSGAAVPDAQVTATDRGTGVSVKITATSAGTYSCPSLIPGLYKVEVEAKGFKSFLKTGVNVIANQDNVADARIDSGVATELVEVAGGSVAIQTTSSELNNTFDSRAMDLPNGAGTLNGSPLNLAVLAPNVVAQPGGVTGIGGSVGGTRPRDNNFTVDGVDDNNLGVTGNNSTVIPDAVELFPVTPRLLSSTPSTMKLLSRGRVPPTDPPIPVTPPGCAITLGASTARFSRLPFSVPAPLGRSTERASNELFREDDVVWTSTAPPVTSIISVAAPNST